MKPRNDNSHRRFWANRFIATTFFLVLIGCGTAAKADDGTVRLSVSGTNTLIQIVGNKDDDWRIQTSSNLVNWTTLGTFGTLLSGANNSPTRSVGNHATSQNYFRALKADGLYDPTLLRTISLTFTQANLTQTTLSNLLTAARAAGTNVSCFALTMDNGATNFGIGARYKGNTSFTQSGVKKSFNLEMDFVTTNADLMGYETINLNNAWGDKTIMREPLYFTVMANYCPCPRGAMAQLYINGTNAGVYSLAQQENSELIKEWFPSNDGDRWRAPNAPAGGNFTSSNSAFSYFGTTNISAYTANYELKTDKSTTNTAFGRLINAIYVLNTTPTNQIRDKLENVFAVDSWLWFLAIENLFVDDDSYWNKGADYGFYYEPESGRIHPVEHDGNEAFTTSGSISYSISPVLYGSNRPLLIKTLLNNELRQRYLAHMRTVISEYYNPTSMTALINQFSALSITNIIEDPVKGYTMASYTNDLIALKQYVTNRYNYLITHSELTPLQPNITSVTGPTNVTATTIPFVRATVTTNGNSGVGSVWLYYRSKPYGRFTVAQMFDDGNHGDGATGDKVFGAATTNFPAGTKVRYYIEARATNVAQAARFSPARAEHETYDYRVALTTTSNSPVVINEFMADNAATITDPQGEYDDWIELHNVTGAEVNLTGHYLSDEPNNPRKWQFPSGTKIAPDGYLLIWADEDTTATPGLHASFKLSKSGEEIYLTDTDANLNQVLDSIVFGAQTTDISFGRSAADADVWTTMTPTPGAPNQ